MHRFEEIHSIAVAYVQEMNARVTSNCWKYQLGFKEEFLDCYFFQAEIDFSNCPKEEFLAGASGFIINKHSLKVEVASHGVLGQIRQEDEEKENIKAFLYEIGAGTRRQLDLKNRFHLTSKELMDLLKLIREEKITVDVLNDLYSKRR